MPFNNFEIANMLCFCLGGSGASGEGDVVSSQQELRGHGTAGIISEEFTLPGHVVAFGTSTDRGGAGN